MSQGSIIPIGGAEEKLRDASILNKFAELCGGSEARIAIIPTASQLDETGERYRKLFDDFGARDVHVLRLRRRLAEAGLSIRTVRSRGYLLETTTDDPAADRLASGS